MSSLTPWIDIVNSILPDSKFRLSDEVPGSILLMFSVLPPEVLIWISALPVPLLINKTLGFSPSQLSQPMKEIQTHIKIRNAVFFNLNSLEIICLR